MRGLATLAVCEEAVNIQHRDLLPPIFDQILVHYESEIAASFLDRALKIAARPHVRADIMTALENGIINAAAEQERAAARLPKHLRAQGPASFEENTVVMLATFDRLSGNHLSRAAICQDIQKAVSLSRIVAEIAVLLIEAQIDLRLKASKSFKLAGIEFAYAGGDPNAGGEPKNIAGWYQDLRQPALHSSQYDVLTVWKRIGRHRPEGLRVLVEGLQLSATLRDAVPYTIKVDKRLVEPLLVALSKDRIRLLHISDLHMVEDLTDPQRGRSPTLGQPMHNFEAAKALGRTVDALSPAFDVLAATGDLTTDGTRGSFETVLQYIRSGSISGENKMRTAVFGMNAGKARRLLLPGNHDRYGGAKIGRQRISSTFEDVLGTSRKYPYVCGFRPPGGAKEDLTVLFFVFDSTLTTESKGKLADKMAVGIVTRDELDDLRKFAAEIVESKRVGSIGGDVLCFDPKNTVRVALLHHAPVKEATEQEVQRKEGRLASWLRSSLESMQEHTTRLIGADDFLAKCLSSGIQLVLFGHLHAGYQRGVVFKGDRAVETPFGPAKALRAFCCATTLEVNDKGNGFYVFDFIDKDTVSSDFYCSMTGSGSSPVHFSRVANKSGRFDLSTLSDSERKIAYEAPYQEEEASPSVAASPTAFALR